MKFEYPKMPAEENSTIHKVNYDLWILGSRDGLLFSKQNQNTHRIFTITFIFVILDNSSNSSIMKQFPIIMQLNYVFNDTDAKIKFSS